MLQHVFKDETKFSLALAWAGKDDDGVGNCFTLKDDPGINTCMGSELALPYFGGCAFIY